MDECAHGDGICDGTAKLPMVDFVGGGKDIWDGHALRNSLADFVEIRLKVCILGIVLPNDDLELSPWKSVTYKYL